MQIYISTNFRTFLLFFLLVLDFSFFVQLVGFLGQFHLCSKPAIADWLTSAIKYQTDREKVRKEFKEQMLQKEKSA